MMPHLKQLFTSGNASGSDKAADRSASAALLKPSANPAIGTPSSHGE
jgi:hypothetical protein